MLKLLTCAQGHFWEAPVAEEEDTRTLTCPVCGEAADSLPLLDLVSSTPAASPAPSAPKPPESAVPEEKRGPVVAGYEIQETLERGPTGVAQYRARQTLVNRAVLLKVVLAREDPGQTAWGSLRGEANALGRLTHPNIVAIFEAGERDRQLFYNALELVEGPTVTEKLGKQPLPWRQAARLVETLARALQLAHDRGIVHRNLKPASIRLQRQDKNEDRTRTTAGSSPFCYLLDGLYLPRILDFGLARRPVEGEITDVELYGSEVGYLSPEQVWGRAREMGPTTDVYALGALLYRLLTGQPPFRGRDRQETIDAIQTEEPLPPVRLQRGIPADMDFVCRKCLSRQPRRRYATARELADDLANCVQGRPIKARLTSRTAQLARWAQRQPAVATLLGLLGVVVIVGLVMALVASQESNEHERERTRLGAAEKQANERAERALREQKRLREALEDVEYQRQFAHVIQALKQNQPQEARVLLQQCSAVGEKYFEWHYLNQELAGHPPVRLGSFAGRITQLAYSPDGRMLAIAGSLDPNQEQGRGEVQVYSTFSRLPAAGWPQGFDVPPQALAFNASGRHLAVSLARLPLQPKNGVGVWSVSMGAHQYTVWLDGDPVSGLAFTPDGSSLLAVEEDGQLCAIDLRTLPPGFVPFGIQVLGRRARMALSADGSRVATGLANSPGVRIWDRQGRRELMTYGIEAVVDLAFDPAHPSLLAVVEDSGHVRLWNISSRMALQKLTAREKKIGRLAYSRDGKRLATQCTDGSIQVWDPNAGQLLLELARTEPAGAGLAFSADGRRLAVAGAHEVKVWGAGD